MLRLITKPFRWIRSKLRRNRHKSEEALNGYAEGDHAESRSKTVFVLGPKYDEATGIIGDWLNNIPIPVELEKHAAIGASVTKDVCNQILSDTTGTNRIMIFGGHGSADALLGPLYTGCECVEVDDNKFAVLYDETSVGNDPGALFAFCCKSAQGLGRRFASSGERSFMGYQGNIGYDLENEECQKVWSKIIHLISEEIVKDGCIMERHVSLLLDLYDDALDYFRNGPGKGNDRDLETILCLIKHKEYLRGIGVSNNVPHV